MTKLNVTYTHYKKNIIKKTPLLGGVYLTINENSLKIYSTRPPDVVFWQLGNLYPSLINSRDRFEVLSEYRNKTKWQGQKEYQDSFHFILHFFLFITVKCNDIYRFSSLGSGENKIITRGILMTRLCNH